MQRQTVELFVFTAANLRQPFVDWFDRLRDRVAQAMVMPARKWLEEARRHRD